MKIKHLVLVAVAFTTPLAVWGGWRLVSSHPLYSGSHSHPFLEKHNHVHTHGDGYSHEHQHFGLIGTTTHSHPHQHEHRHELDVDLSETSGLVEIGHRHRSSSTVHFWAKAELSNDKVFLRCWTHRGQKLVELTPSDCSARIFNGSQFVCDVDLKGRGKDFSAILPSNYLPLPTHVLKLPDLKIGEEEFDAVLPLEVKKP